MILPFIRAKPVIDQASSHILKTQFIASALFRLEKMRSCLSRYNWSRAVSVHHFEKNGPIDPRNSIDKVLIIDEAGWSMMFFGRDVSRRLKWSLDLSSLSVRRRMRGAGFSVKRASSVFLTDYFGDIERPAFECVGRWQSQLEWGGLC